MGRGGVARSGKVDRSFPDRHLRCHLSSVRIWSVLDRLQERAEPLTTAAEFGRPVPELRSIGVHQYRELVERQWRIVYRIEPDSVMVLAALDGRRDLESLLLDRLVRS